MLRIIHLIYTMFLIISFFKNLIGVLLIKIKRYCYIISVISLGSVLEKKMNFADYNLKRKNNEKNNKTITNYLYHSNIRFY
jgi:hypothetical protein